MKKIYILTLITMIPWIVNAQVYQVDVPVGSNGVFQMEVDCSTVMSRAVGTKLDGKYFETGTKLPTPWESTDIAKAKCKSVSSGSSSGATTNEYDSGESCSELRTRYSRCVKASMMGEQCRPEDDIVMPNRCRSGPGGSVR